MYNVFSGDGNFKMLSWSSNIQICIKYGILNSLYSCGRRSQRLLSKFEVFPRFVDTFSAFFADGTTFLNYEFPSASLLNSKYTQTSDFFLRPKKNLKYCPHTAFSHVYNQRLRILYARLCLRDRYCFSEQLAVSPWAFERAVIRFIFNDN